MNLTSNNLFDEIKTLLSKARSHVIQTVNTTMVVTYFEIGKLIVEHEQKWEKRAEYNKQTLLLLSQQLIKEFWKWFSVTNIQQMRAFYLAFKKQQTVSVKSQRFSLSWSHYVRLLSINDKDERDFYEKESIHNNWSLRELKRQFDSSLYERIILSRDKKWVLEDNLKKYHVPNKPEDVIKDPYVLEFLWLKEDSSYSESSLEQAIIDKLEHFLLELWKWFTFVWRQKRFTFDEEHFFVDLVFYNRLLKCFVIIDLKIWKLKHQDLWQIQMYVNYYDRFVKTEDENPTIGIILCKDKNDTLVEITLPKNSNIFASEYKLYLPTKEELKKQIEDL